MNWRNVKLATTSRTIVLGLVGLTITWLGCFFVIAQTPPADSKIAKEKETGSDSAPSMGVLLPGSKTLASWSFDAAEGWVEGSAASLVKAGWNPNDPANSDEQFFVKEGVLHLRDLERGTPTARYEFEAVTHGRLEVGLGNYGQSVRNAALRICDGKKVLWEVVLNDQSAKLLSGGKAETPYQGRWLNKTSPHLFVWDVNEDGSGGKFSLYSGSVVVAASLDFQRDGIPNTLEIKTGFGSGRNKSLLLDDLKIVSGDSRPPAGEPGEAGLKSPIFDRKYYADGIGEMRGFTPDSSKSVHPVPGLRVALQWAQSPPERSDVEKRVRENLAIAEKDVPGRVAAESIRIKSLRHPDEPMAEALAQMYLWTGDEKYARRAAVLLTALADQYAWKGYAYDGGFDFAIRTESINAYDLIYDAPVWKSLENCTGEPARLVVEAWFRKSAVDFRDHCEDAELLHNCVPYSIRRVAAAGVVLNDPYVVRCVIPALDHFFQSGATFHADGVWMEGAPVYHSMVTGNSGVAMAFLRQKWSDPADYTDKVYGLRLDHTDLASTRYPFFSRAQNAVRSLVFPDGAKVSINDQGRTPPTGKLTENQSNIELNDFGHFALTRTPTLDGMQAHLHFAPVSSHGHNHQDRLQLILWAAGRDVLPDTGYARNRDRPHFTYWGAHNLSLPVGGDGTAAASWPPTESESLRSGLLGYDPGVVSDKKVQFIAAQSPGPEHENVAVRERRLLLVAIDEERSYLFDAFHMQGGTLHQSFLRQQEDEDCEMTCSLELSGPSLSTDEPAPKAADIPSPSGRGTLAGINKGILRLRMDSGTKRIPLDSVKLVSAEGVEQPFAEWLPQIRETRELGFYEHDGTVTEIRGMVVAKASDGSTLWPHLQKLSADHVTESGLPFGYRMLPGYKDMFTEERFGDGSRDFHLTWTGKESGTALRCFLNGISALGSAVGDVPTPSGRGTLAGMNKGILRLRTDEGLKQIPLSGVKLLSSEGEELAFAQWLPRIKNNPEVGFYESDGKVTEIREMVSGSRSEVILSLGPRLGGDYSNTADSLPAWYLNRNRTVTADQTTCFGAVYDAWQKENGPRVESVEWLSPQPADPMAIAARVVIGDREDLVYVSSDTTPRTVAGVTMAGRAAVLSRQKDEAQRAYVYGEGEVRWMDGEITGTPDISVPLTGVLSKDAGDNANAVIVDGEISTSEPLDGEWLRVVHGDTSANGFRIESAENKDGKGVLHLHNPPGFKVVPEGTARTHFPQGVVMQGEPSVEILRPTFWTK